ncbi:MAG: hypothetical protein JXQ67_09360 [Campylobacterales bacterium]|nr:hypothetical protein [Campylobacterales bacterium]
MRKYFSVLFLLATLLGTLHHHHDTAKHDDCKVCTIASELSHADIPVETVYLSSLENYSQKILLAPKKFISLQRNTKLTARAPPYLF